jgi:hypothetical protein
MMFPVTHLWDHIELLDHGDGGDARHLHDDVRADHRANAQQYEHEDVRHVQQVPCLRARGHRLHTGSPVCMAGATGTARADT